MNRIIIETSSDSDFLLATSLLKDLNLTITYERDVSEMEDADFDRSFNRALSEDDFTLEMRRRMSRHFDQDGNNIYHKRRS